LPAKEKNRVFSTGQLSVHRPQEMQSASVTFSTSMGAIPMGHERVHLLHLMQVSPFLETFVRLNF